MTDSRISRILWLSAIGLAGLAIAYGSRMTQAKEPISLATVTAPMEGVVFDLQSCGCFDCSHYRLRYTPGPTPRVKVSRLPVRYDRVWSAVDRFIPPPEEQVATVTLTRREVLGLDRLLNQYRKPSGYGCTQRNLVKIRHYSGGWTLRFEEYFDSSCSNDTLLDADPRDLQTIGKQPSTVVPLERLIQLAAAAEQRGVSTTPYVRLRRQDTTAYWQAQEIRAANLRKHSESGKIAQD